jgi:hypothetical protein
MKDLKERNRIVVAGEAACPRRRRRRVGRELRHSSSYEPEALENIPSLESWSVVLGLSSRGGVGNSRS